MDWDDDKPRPAKPAAPVTVGEPLSNLSIAELEARIAALTQEIDRVRQELSTKRAHEAAAASLFKS
ncbi:MAG TPA: DUF1192 domain-containing protein [Hyphomicrobiaceae bacterium]|nr:DUF1192 domain-containing protein [Hyphomicrobiaceae bacterium]